MIARLQPPFEAYRGGGPYVFVSYSHEDSREVYEELRRFNDAGFNIWYDEGIAPAHNWPEMLARSIEESALFLLFVSPNSVSSNHCLRETSYAVAHDIPTLAIHLEPTQLPSGLELEIGSSQALHRFELSADQYEAKTATVLAEFLGRKATDAPAQTAQRRRSPWIAASMLAALLIAAAIYLLLPPAAQQSPGPADVMLQDLQPLIDDEHYFEAFLRSRNMDLTLAKRAEFIRPGEFRTDPPGALVSIRPLNNENGSWSELGETPTGVIELPLGVFEVRLRKAGFSDMYLALTNPSLTLGNAIFGASLDWQEPVIPLGNTSGDKQDMVFVPAGKFIMEVSGFPIGELGLLETGAFFIDRYEVTNAEYQAFVDAGAYEDPTYWSGMAFRDRNGPLSFEKAIAGFVDTTGRAGPSTWELGTFPPGKENHPVAGVSWYEATAYARFAEKKLPNVYHWARAAYSPHGGNFGAGVSLPPAMVANSNFGGRDTVAVGSLNSIGAYGAFDQTGNVREWTSNRLGDGRWLVGGGWDDFHYMSTLAHGEHPIDRSALNGFRLSDPVDPVDPALLDDYQLNVRDPEHYVPVNDDVYAVLIQQFSKSPLPLDPKDVGTPRPLGQLTYRKVSLRTGMDDDRFVLHLLLPPGESARGSVVVFPGIGFFTAGSRQPPEGFLNFISFLATDNRAIVLPEYMGSLTRTGGVYRNYTLPNSGFETWLLNWHNELGRTIDYLESQPQTFGDRFFYYGHSYGAGTALPLLALEPRLSGAILAIGGIRPQQMPLELIDAVNYVPRITMPVLYMAASLDPIFPYLRSQIPFLELLGTPEADVRFVSYPGGHNWPSRKVMLNESVAFLEKYSR